MAVYSLTATSVSQTTPVLKKGQVILYSAVPIFYAVGENPVANRTNCALLRAGETREMRFPVKCSRVAILAVDQPGAVTVAEHNGGAKASCS